MSEIEQEVLDGQKEVAEAPQEDIPQVDPEIEADARKYGWKPKEEFTLDPEGWVTADRFLELPSTQRKMTQDINRRLEKELKDRDERLERLTATATQAVELARMQERKRYEEQIAQIEAEKREAADLGDVARYDQLTRHQSTLKAPTDTPVVIKPQVDPAFQSYLDAAAWTKDPDAYRFAAMAIDDHPEIQRLPPLKQVQWAETKVREHFPEHFPAQVAKPQFSKVDGGGLGAIGKRGKGADDLPAEAKQVGLEFVKDGIFKSLAEYAASYFDQEKRA